MKLTSSVPLPLVFILVSLACLPCLYLGIQTKKAEKSFQHHQNEGKTLDERTRESYYRSR